MLITRRHDISNECKGSDCTAICCLCVIATQWRFSRYKMVLKSQPDAFSALSLTGFSTKPDGLMLITRRHDIYNECKGRRCTAMCGLCVIATQWRFSRYK